LDQKVRRLLAVHPAVAHGLGQFRELSGGFTGDRRSGFLGSESGRVVEHPAEFLPDEFLFELLDQYLPWLIGVAGKGGMDDDALPIADDQQRRVVQMGGHSR